MKKKYSDFLLSFVAVACTVFSAGVAAQAQPKTGERYQITPVGGGPGVWQTMPADSHSDSRAGPGIPESVLHPVVPSQAPTVINNYYPGGGSGGGTPTYLCTGGTKQNQLVFGPWECTDGGAN
jgi:hypothetical protein